ncbi:bifunctional methyltransferase/pyrophosphohydrolase YabN [Pectinatus haikarae]|uniref:Tetrapyrrole methylase family protein/MazG family protein n=1 Tax=Pectinatus haikarae TaxID=349096 RepID=A0ABT9Y6H1_9FIRM|nr:nucleoside triphosphate pyrophosphohydrolase [Pectinatus haikarae]MDQ0203435.1 tetrapyrrole methylase family protein/MazG family protein [Pectinatus haikarae]
MGKIEIVGLGPSGAELITRETWRVMAGAELLCLRTKYHPAADELEKEGVSFITYDRLYEEADSFEDVYERISNDIVERAKSTNVVYAVPGSPMVAERTVGFIKKLALAKNIELKIYPGMSFLELIYTQLGIDPINGLLITDALALKKQEVNLASGVVITQLYDIHTASEVKLTLMNELPDDYEVVLLYRLGLPEKKITRLPLFELDRHKEIDYLTSLYVPAFQRQKDQFTLSPLEDIINRLRAPGGCPWDIIQTHKSLRQNLIEEVYEVIEAIDFQDPKLLCEELGDLLMQIVFHARMAEETGFFSMQDVIDGVTKKLVHRHPHVFGDISVRDAGEVLLNWEAIKRQEKSERKSILDGIPKDLPALMSAYKLQNKASKAGFDWKNVKPVWQKLSEEINELKEAEASGDRKKIEDELGDVLFTIVNLSRFLKVNAEIAMLGSNEKFRRRFSYIEKKIKAEKRQWETYEMEELDTLWDEAKDFENARAK